jgi:hypothetical protein
VFLLPTFCYITVQEKQSRKFTIHFESSSPLFPIIWSENQETGEGKEKKKKGAKQVVEDEESSAGSSNGRSALTIFVIKWLSPPCEKV